TRFSGLTTLSAVAPDKDAWTADGGAADFCFHAEDGIRDKLVTGVQTCALPISSSGRRSAFRPAAHCWPVFPNSARCWRRKVESRSEERRVGKECRSRLSARHYKDNVVVIEVMMLELLNHRILARMGK